MYETLLFKLLPSIFLSLFLIGCEPTLHTPIQTGGNEPLSVSAYQYYNNDKELMGKKVVLSGIVYYFKNKYILDMIPTDEEVKKRGKKKNYIISVNLQTPDSALVDNKKYINLSNYKNKDATIVGRIEMLEEYQSIGLTEIETITINNK